MNPRYLLLSVALLCGCVSVQPVNWVRAWPGSNEIYKDRAVCEYEVTAAIQYATPGITRGVNNPIGQGIVQGIDIAFRRSELFIQCMRAKGWRRGEPGETGARAVMATTGTILEAPHAPASIPTPYALAQPPKAPTKWLMQAETAAKAERCAQSPIASVSVVGPGFETYNVPCANGDTLVVRCDAGACRALK